MTKKSILLLIVTSTGQNFMNGDYYDGIFNYDGENYDDSYYQESTQPNNSWPSFDDAESAIQKSVEAAPAATFFNIDVSKKVEQMTNEQVREEILKDIKENANSDDTIQNMIGNALYIGLQGLDLNSLFNWNGFAVF